MNTNALKFNLKAILICILLFSNPLKNFAQNPTWGFDSLGKYTQCVGEFTTKGCTYYDTTVYVSIPFPSGHNCAGLVNLEAMYTYQYINCFGTVTVARKNQVILNAVEIEDMNCLSIGEDIHAIASPLLDADLISRYSGSTSRVDKLIVGFLSGCYSRIDFSIAAGSGPWSMQDNAGFAPSLKPLFSNTFTSSGLFKCSDDDICCYYYYDPSGNLTPLSVNNAPVDCPTTNPMVTPDSLVVEGLGLTNQMPASAVTVTSASSCYNVLCYDNTLPLVGIKSARAEFPNKTEIIAINKDKFRISYKGTPISSHLVDIQGKLIKENLDNYLDLSQSPNGMYILNIRYANSSESIKFVK